MKFFEIQPINVYRHPPRYGRLQSGSGFLRVTKSNNAVTTATYDVFGRFTSLARPTTAGVSENPPSLNVSYQNSPFKVTLTQEIDTGLTFTVVRNYDGMGRQTSTVTNGVTVKSTFNAYGKPLSQSMPHASGAWFYTWTTYDKLGRPVRVEAPDTTVTTYNYDGLTTGVKDAKDHTHTTVTNVLGRTLSVTPPTGPAVAFTYDALGNMLKAERGNATVALKYDNAGRKVGMDDPDMGADGPPDDANWGWDYQYDALGNLTDQTDPRGCVTHIQYDVLNRPTQKTYSSCPSSVASTATVTYTYDTGTNGKGRRVSMGVTGGDYTSWNYDLRGRVLSENKQILPNGGQFVTSFTYNTADLPKTMTYPDGEVVNIDYNNNMLPISVDGLSDYAQSIAYDSANRMVELIRGANAINTAYTYNNWNVDGGRLQNLTSTQVSTGTQLQNLSYDYDDVGNINTITDYVTKDSSNNPQKQCFQYDDLDRLTQSTVSFQAANQGCSVQAGNGNYNEGYTYNDLTGNLASKNNVNYTAYDANHKHAATTLSNGNTYGYDANGNMTSRHVFEIDQFKNYTLIYDAENRLESVTGAGTAEFDYDGDGKQVKATVNGITTVYVGNHYEVKNSVVTKYYFAGSTRLAVRTDGTLRFLLGDHLGSSSVTANASGAKTASALYKAFGETRFTSGTLFTDYKFTGQREESALGGIYFFQARWFDPSLGRFMSPDTVVPTSTQGTQAWDRYAFVNNNPVRFTDPTGHCISGGIDTLICAIVAIAILTSSCAPSMPSSNPILDSAVGIVTIGSDGKPYGSMGTYTGNGQIYTHDHFDSLQGSVNPEDSSQVILVDASGNTIGSYSGSEISRQVTDPSGSSIITLPNELSLSPASITSGFSNLTNGMQVGSAAYIDPQDPTKGMTVQWGQITNQGTDYFHTSQALPPGNSGTGAWILYNGIWYLIGNLATGSDDEARFDEE